MNSKRIYYSCSTWLSYHICQRYYGQRHYAWCSPYFDATSAHSQPNSVPPSSNPRDIYWSLKREVDAGDLHSAKIQSVRSGIRRGAAIRRRAGMIGSVQLVEILDMVARCGSRVLGMNILDYVESAPYDIASEALFYCFRAFNRLDWPAEMRGDIFFDAPSSIPGPESRAITLAILAGIEEEQKKPLDQIDKNVLSAYAREIGATDEILLDRLPVLDSARGEELLREMRAERYGRTQR